MLEVSSVSFMGKPSKAVTKKITTTIKEVAPEVKSKAKDVLAEEMAMVGRINKAVQSANAKSKPPLNIANTNNANYQRKTAEFSEHLKYLKVGIYPTFKFITVFASCNGMLSNLAKNIFRWFNIIKKGI